ncbi:MAG: hypothetical protein KGH98_02145 [Candidatus Micrarchaeota archaeon]|nr:hypothetical protein [Candidatus Micrarchaeota archaeon]
MMRLQFWSFDIIFAVVIFSVAITILAFAWFNLSGQLAIVNGGGTIILQIQAQDAKQSVMSPGYPAAWQTTINTTNTLTWAGVVAGITTAPSNTTISPAKLAALESLSKYNYLASKQVVGVSYDYYITIRGGQFNISIGENPNLNKALTTEVRTASGFLNGVPVTVKVMVWTGTSLGTS